MKRPRASDGDPAQIASIVKHRLEAALQLAGILPDRPGFLDSIEVFVATLATWGARTNLTTEPDSPDALVFHILDSLAPLTLATGADHRLAGIFEPGRRVLDLGAGAGFPGLVLAAATGASLTLAESRRKRASFLAVAAAAMTLDNVAIVARADRFEGEFDLALSRGVGIGGGFLEIAARALKPGGLAILYASESQPIDRDRAKSLGLNDFSVIAYSVARGDRTLAHQLLTWRKL